jgi:hypothetical protein
MRLGITHRFLRLLRSEPTDLQEIVPRGQEFVPSRFVQADIGRDRKQTSQRRQLFLKRRFEFFVFRGLVTRGESRGKCIIDSSLRDVK